MELVNWLINSGFHYLICDLNGNIVNSRIDKRTDKKVSKNADATDCANQLQDLFTPKSCATILSVDNLTFVTLSYISNEEHLIDGVVLQCHDNSNNLCLILSPQRISDTVMSKFVSRVAHDIRNPIGIATTHLELAKMNLLKTGRSEKELAHTDNALNALKQAMEILADLKKTYS